METVTETVQVRKQSLASLRIRHRKIGDKISHLLSAQAVMGIEIERREYVAHDMLLQTPAEVHA